MKEYGLNFSSFLRLHLVNEFSPRQFLAFERISNGIRQLGNITQQARAAFQYATLNVFQMSSRQQQQQQPQNSLLANNSQTPNAIAFAQLQAMQQQKSSSSSSLSSIHRIGGSLHTTP